MTAKQTLDLLRRYESRNVTFIEPDGTWPIVWKRAKGVHVWDADGHKYLDLTAAFGVAAAGHANPRVIQSGQRQMAKLVHAMGDVHPHALKAQLARELSRLTFERWARNQRGARQDTPPTGKTIFCNSGFEAVEAALKTAMLATGKRGVIAFEGGYHGLGYGALNATHREHFRWRFRAQLGGFGYFVPFPVADSNLGKNSSHFPPGRGAGSRDSLLPVPLREGARVGLAQIEAHIRRFVRREKIGAILVEPVQVRGGVNVPP